MLSVENLAFVLSVIILNVTLLSVFKLSVVAPFLTEPAAAGFKPTNLNHELIVLPLRYSLWKASAISYL
jgi:hypothetical protein